MYKLLLATILYVLSSLSSAAEVASPEIVLTPQGCFFVAQALEAAVVGKNQGLSLQDQTKDLNKIEGLHPSIKDLFSKELIKIYGVYKNLLPEVVGKQFFENCYKHRGNIEKLTKNGTSV